MTIQKIDDLVKARPELKERAVHRAKENGEDPWIRLYLTENEPLWKAYVGIVLREEKRAGREEEIDLLVRLFSEAYNNGGNLTDVACLAHDLGAKPK